MLEPTSIFRRMPITLKLSQRRLMGLYAIQVRGCFWHAHGCRRANRPQSNTDYWVPKLARNVARDRKVDDGLRELGWRVSVVWECEIASANMLEEAAAQVGREINRRARKP
jgi:DNA mismatch endonuclease (patch repair protein)